MCFFSLSCLFFQSLLLDEAPPVGSVGLVSEEERLKQLEADALKHATRNMDKKHHLLTKQEEWEEEQKEKKRLEMQERTRQRIAEAEKNNPDLKKKNPHIL